MSKDIREMRDEIRAPRHLVEAAKKGERVAPRRKTDTNATHIRRFTKAFAVYACAALVLIGGSLTLPALLSDPATPAPMAQPSLSTDTQKPYYPIDYVRPDLIWANEHAPELKDTVIWAAEKVGGKTSVLSALTLPNVGGEDAEYAVELRMEIDEEAKHATNTFMVRHMVEVRVRLEEMGFEAVDVLPADDSVRSFCFAASRAELAAFDAETILPLLERADGDLRFKLQIAWQSIDGSQTPTEESGIKRNGSNMDLADLWLDRYVYSDKEDYLRPDLIWANEDNRLVDVALFSANRWANGLENYSLTENRENVTDYTFAVDVQLMFVLEGGPTGDRDIVTGADEAKMVEQVLGWKPIVAGESYEATCEQIMALNDAELIPVFAEAYESLYGVDADSIPYIFIYIEVAWQSVE